MSVMDRGPVRVEPRLDPRGVRLSAALTTAVLALVLLSGSGLLVTAQAVVFAVGAIAGMRFAPYTELFRYLFAPRLAPPAGREDPAAVRFSQTVGLVLTALAAAGYLSGADLIGVVATAVALAAAFLDAAFGFGPGRELYGLLARLRTGAEVPATQS